MNKLTNKEKKMTKNVTFCITGKLDGIERKDALSLIESKTNAKWVSGVSSKTHYLISMRTDTSKAAKAKSFGTKVIGQKEMMAYVNKGKFPTLHA